MEIALRDIGDKGSKEMAKKITGSIKLEIAAGAATPSPPVGPALGQRGLNIMEFCKAFNDATKDMEKGMPVPVIITAYEDRSFTFVTKTPPASYLIKKAISLKKGSSVPNKDKVGVMTMDQARSIAEMKMADLNAHNLEMATRMIIGSARSMGVEVKG